MSSIESGLSDSQSSNRPADQDKANARLERELDDVSREPDNNWWNAPVPNRLTAAFHIGRLFNQLDWHLQHVLFLVSPVDKKMIDEVLDHLVAVSCNPVVTFPDYVGVVIAEYRDIWKEWVLCEAAAEEATACYDDRELSRLSETSQGCRRELVTVRVQRPLRELRDRIFEKLSNEERWAFDLGRRLDDGLRRSDVHRYFDAEYSVEENPSPFEEDNWCSVYLKGRETVRSFKPGELEPNPAWTLNLQQLLTRSGVSVAASTTILETWKRKDPQDRISSLPRTIEQLDRCVREHFGAFDIETAGTTTQETTTETHAPPEEITAELPVSPARVDGQPSVEQPLAEKTPKPNFIPDKYLSRILTKKEAAEIHAGGKVANPTTYIEGLVKDGLMTQPLGSGQKWRFSIQDFDPDVQDKVRRPSEESSAT